MISSAKSHNLLTPIRAAGYNKRTSRLQPTGCSCCLHNRSSQRWTDSGDSTSSCLHSPRCTSPRLHDNISMHKEVSRTGNAKRQPHPGPWEEGQGTRGTWEMSRVYPKQAVHMIAGLRGFTSTRNARAPVYWSHPQGEISCRHSWSHFIGYMLGVRAKGLSLWTVYTELLCWR